ncbi:MAG: hypothetical protein GX757_05300 [Clostridiales bacterium]|nr:hypothetical protein [Clostridiales bacterium]
MNECELVVFVSTIACSLAKCLSEDELAILAAVFSQLGDTIETILTHREINEKCEGK